MKFILKTAVVLGLGWGCVMQAQTVGKIMKEQGPFRKDTILSVKDTYLPVTVIKGREKGPVFSIVAGIHGYEYPPIIAVQEILQEIKPESVKGTLIIVPIASVESFLKRTPFINPLDQKNLNNAFPGSFAGSPTGQIADLITREIISNSTVFLDIHGGDANEDLLPFVCYYDRKDKLDKTVLAHNLSVQSQIGLIVSYPYTISAAEPAKYAFKQAVQQGITAVSIEAGKLGTVQTENVEMIKTAVYNMLDYVKVYAKDQSKSNHQNSFVHLSQQDYIRVPESGIFYSDLKSGDRVKKKQVLGYITDEFGKKKQDIISDSEGMILYKAGTPPVNKGETLFCIGYNQY